MRRFVGIVLLISVIALSVFPGPIFAEAGKIGEPANFLSSEWLVLGPFANPSIGQWGDCAGFNRDYLSDCGGEAQAHPGPNQKAAGKVWRICRSNGGTLDFTAVFGRLQNSVVYAYQEFRSDRQQSLALKLGSDDGIKVWLNGRLVWEQHLHRSLVADEDALRVEVKTGINRLLIKVDQGNGGWGFTARFRSLNDEIIAFREKDSHPARLRINLINRFPETSKGLRGNRTISAYVTTLPALAVAIPIEIKLYDNRGQLLAREETRTGERAKLAIPGGYQNLARIQAAGTGSYASLASDPVTVFAGDPVKISRVTVVWARRTAKGRPASRGEDLAATLTFLADQLEGKVHPSLITTERNIRAIESLIQLQQSMEQCGDRPWQPGILRGLRQWAYRSPIDGSCQPYTLYLPDDFNPQRRYSLLVTLHGYSGDDYGAATSVLEGVRPRDFIVVAPFGRGDLAYGTIGEQDVLDLMDLVMRIYPVDPNRVYLTGISMGGCGTWRIGQFYADRFAAIAPFCGWTGTDYLENLKNLPVLVVHGEADTSVPIANDATAVACLQDLGYQVRFEPLAGVDHNAWGGWLKVHRGNGLFDYLRRFSREPWPRQVVLTTSYLRYHHQYWVDIGELAGQGRGFLNAQVIDSRHVRVTTENLAVFSLDLRHPALAQNGRILVEIDGYAVPADAGGQAEFVYSPARGCFGWQPQHSAVVLPHQGGGLADLVTGPVYIVYGTHKPGRTALLKQSAAILADWSINSTIGFGTKVGRLRVKPDTAVTGTDISGANLILLGTAEENRLTAKYLADLKRVPLKLDRKTVTVQGKKYPGTGIVLVYPNPEAPRRLLGIIALPFKTEMLERFMVQLNLSWRQYAPDNGVGNFTTPDLMVFKPSGEVLWSGSFNRHWQLP